MDGGAFHLDSVKRQSLLEWLQTFVVDEPVATGFPSTISWQVLADGVFLARVLHQMDPDYLSMDAIKEEAGGSMNWILKLANFNAIARSVESFYHEELSVRCEVANHVDLNRIARAETVDTDVEIELSKVALMLLHCAVNCAERQTFVVRIMNLEQHVQQSVMAMIEQISVAFPPLSPLHGSSALSPSLGNLDTTPVRGFSGEQSEEVKDLRSRLGAMEKKWQDAEHDKREITKEYEALSAEVQASRKKINILEEENNRLTSERQQAVARDNKKLEELVNAEKHSLTIELQAKTEELLQVKKESSERLIVLEHEVRRQADELDISRSKLVALAKLESTVTKYKQKLDEMNTVKQHVKEVEAQNAAYLEKMLDLESTVKTMASLKSSIEKYKNQVVELETANVEAMSTLQIKEQKCRQLQDDLESALHGKEFLEHQLEEMRSHIPQEGGDVNYTSAADLLGGGLDLREQIARLQRENRQLKEQVASSTTSSNSTATPSVDILALQNERDDALRAKDAWQAKALDFKRQYDLLAESTKGAAATGASGVSSAQLAQLEATNARLATQLQAHEEQARKMAANTEESDSFRATIAELTNRLKEKETVINNLSQDKEKLETYTKKTLHAVQSKYMVAVSTHRNQLAEKQAKVDMLETKLKELKTSQKREQELLMSSFYEIGGEMQRRTMMPQAPASASSAPLAAWLPSKRSDRSSKR